MTVNKSRRREYLMRAGNSRSSSMFLSVHADELYSEASFAPELTEASGTISVTFRKKETSVSIRPCSVVDHTRRLRMLLRGAPFLPARSRTIPSIRPGIDRLVLEIGRLAGREPALPVSLGQPTCSDSDVRHRWRRPPGTAIPSPLVHPVSSQQEDQSR